MLRFVLLVFCCMFGNLFKKLVGKWIRLFVVRFVVDRFVIMFVVVFFLILNIDVCWFFLVKYGFVVLFYGLLILIVIVEIVDSFGFV